MKPKDQPFLSSIFPGQMKNMVGYDHFLPGDLFLSERLTWGINLAKKSELAAFAVNSLAAEVRSLPDPTFFILALKNKESLASSIIEGTLASVDELYQKEELVDKAKHHDWKEVHQCVKGLNKAIEDIQTLPLSLRMMKDIHRIILDQARGRNKMPGQFRKSQNWIGGSTLSNAHFVPPSPDSVLDAMANLEEFFHGQSDMPTLIKAGLIHYQFETIHPFLDGNGRVGRILIPIHLISQKVIDLPIVYLSEYFERNQDKYYQYLDAARKDEKGMFEWVDFFLDGIIQTAEKSSRKVQKMKKLRRDMDAKIKPLASKESLMQLLLDYLYFNPIFSASDIIKELDFTSQAACKLINNFEALGIIQKTAPHQRNRCFKFGRFLDEIYEG